MRIEVVEACMEHNRNTPLAAFLSGLLAQIEKDRKVVENLITRRGETVGRQDGLCMARGKSDLVENKSHRTDDLGRLEEQEMMVTGIRGKLALWESLDAVRMADERLREIDFGTLQERARQQLEGVEARRVEAARRAFLEH